MSDGGKGDKRRPGEGYDVGWDRIFGRDKAKEVKQNNEVTQQENNKQDIANQTEEE